VPAKILTGKRRRPSPSATALLTSSLPNTPFASPSVAISDERFAPTRATPTRCHICGRSHGITLRVSECEICERGMCQVCTRTCIVCERERCSKCCVEGYRPQTSKHFPIPLFSMHFVREANFPQEGTKPIRPALHVLPNTSTMTRARVPTETRW